MNNNSNESLPAADTTSTKTTLLKHARTLFAERGYDGVSVRDIVGAAGMNVSLVSYYFGGKEGLYRTCLQTLAEGGLVNALSDLPPATNAASFRAGVTTIARAFLQAGQDDPDGQKMAIREFCNTTPIFAELLETVYRKPTHQVQDYFVEAQRHGFIKPTLNPAILASILCSQLHSQNYFEELRKRYLNLSLGNPEFMDTIVHHVVESFCSGVMA
jgi:TetR/AcrR family transcriptional regulator